MPGVAGAVRGLHEHRLLTARPAGSCKVDNGAIQAGGGNGGGGDSGCKHLGGNDDNEGRVNRLSRALQPSSVVKGLEMPYFPGSVPSLSFGWLLLLSGLNAGPAHALLKKKKKPAPNASTEVDKLVDLIWPIVKNLGFSGILGATAAFAFKVCWLLKDFALSTACQNDINALEHLVQHSLEADTGAGAR